MSHTIVILTRETIALLHLPCVHVVARYRCTQVPCPCRPAPKSNPSFVVKDCHHQPAPHKESYYSRSSDIVALIRVDPSLLESFLLVEILRCNPVVSSPLSCVLLPGPSILIVTTWQHVSLSRTVSLLVTIQPASQPAHSPTSLSQALPEHQSPTISHHQESDGRHRESGQDASPPTHPIIANKGNPHDHAHELSGPPLADYQGHYASWSWLKGCVEAHQRLCCSFWPTAPGRPSTPPAVQGLTPLRDTLTPAIY